MGVSGDGVIVAPLDLDVVDGLLAGVHDVEAGGALLGDRQGDEYP
jgi:hypothetical protein